MKTNRQHLESLPEPYNHMAIKNTRKRQLEGEACSKADAVFGAFIWVLSPEGSDFWNAIYEECLHEQKMKLKI